MKKIIIAFLSLFSFTLSFAQQVGQAEITKAMEYYEQHDMKQAIYWFE
ncbi:MAG: hypothetical protein K2H97_03595 [Prevotella sp.]|nr:hypothetical protein [Prevotella sp.]